MPIKRSATQRQIDAEAMRRSRRAYCSGCDAFDVDRKDHFDGRCEGCQTMRPVAAKAHRNPRESQARRLNRHRKAA